MTASRRACMTACRLWLAAGLLPGIGGVRQCPGPSDGFSSVNNMGHGSSEVIVENEANVQVEVRWVDYEGKEKDANTIIGAGDTGSMNSYLGHAFRVYAEDGKKTLMTEFKVSTSKYTAVNQACGAIPPVQANHARDQEMLGLVHDQHASCEPRGRSGAWSCVRKIDKDEYMARPKDGVEYGFATKQEAGSRSIGEIWDRGYVAHMKQVPRVANTSGFLKMSFSQKLKDALLPFYAEHKKGGAKDSVKVHEPIAGGYTNSHVVPLSKLDLDRFRHVQTQVHAELKDYLEWWTGMRLQHTSTFGIRIYHRGSMLIDHVDRADTHIASAVIQVGQETDEDGGWPLEVIDEEGNCFEVYLQPGELVLYEGGRFRHGRPMRFKGNSFANIFSHFSPKEWHGPGKSPKYDGHLDSHGWLQEAPGHDQPFHLEI